MTNSSPWIHELDKEREVKKLDKDIKTDVAIIGAGIAGVATAFYLLKHTEKRVTVLEAYKLAHGATGHNAGQLVTYFEKPFREIVEEFGLDMACEGQRDVDSAWELLDEMYTEAGLDISLSKFTGYSGLSTKEQVLGHLENNALRRKCGFYTHPVEVWEDADFLGDLTEKYHDQVSVVSREEIALKLETFDPQYLAVLSIQKGVMNSALFCQEVVRYLSEKYGDRFVLYEHAPINKVVVHEDKVILDAESHTIECDKVVLCTNGFENFDIITSTGLSLNARFHHNIGGIVAFMSGYLEEHTGVPTAISYFQKKDPGLTDNPGDPYFYVTRRAYEYEKNNRHNLICVGGPDYTLEKRHEYNRDMEFSTDAKKLINDFIQHTYDKKGELDHAFMWHGVMGYTKNLLRMVGPDPKHDRVFYNLGCNGTGLMPSIFGGSKVARQVAREKFPPSIFDIPIID